VRFRAVLFDFYDTLAWVDAPVIEAARATLAVEVGVDAAALTGAWRATREERFLGRLGSLEADFRLVLERAGISLDDDSLARLAAFERRAWLAAVRLYDDALPTLAALRQHGLKLAIVSNCSSQAGEVMEALGITGAVDYLALSYQLGIAKPDPAIFLAACHALDVAPAACLFVADGAFNELDAAAALGMTTVLVVQPHQSKDFGSSRRWHHRVARLAEVVPLATNT